MNQFKILLVDDSPLILKALERMLKNRGYEIFRAASGHEALEVLNAYEIDLIITDENMPGLSGTNLLGALKTLYPDVIRIMLTGMQDVEVLKNAINKGEIYRFFTKPWDDFELSIAVRQGLQQRQLQKENATLKGIIGRQSKVMTELEKEYPGISQKNLASDGSLIINED
ncbi:Response regulator receiver protein [Candidatus Zixiibacteriota bacterium]|nr:Response regulator receiver protein [candidate division Zixibacteria bacterium]